MLLQSFQEVLDLKFRCIPYNNLHRVSIKASIQVLFLLKQHGYSIGEGTNSGTYIYIWHKHFFFKDYIRAHAIEAILINGKIVTPCINTRDVSDINLKFTEDIL